MPLWMARPSCFWLLWLLEKPYTLLRQMALRFERESYLRTFCVKFGRKINGRQLKSDEEKERNSSGDFLPTIKTLPALPSTEVGTPCQRMETD